MLPQSGGFTHIPLFQGAKETAQSSARTQPSPAVPMEENSLYASWQCCTCRGSGWGRGGFWLSAAVLTLTFLCPHSDRISSAGGPDRRV